MTYVDMLDGGVAGCGCGAAALAGDVGPGQQHAHLRLDLRDGHQVRLIRPHPSFDPTGVGNLAILCILLVAERVALTDRLVLTYVRLLQATRDIGGTS